MNSSEKNTIRSLRRLFADLDDDHDLPKWEELYTDALQHVEASKAAARKGDFRGAVRAMGWALFRLGTAV